MSDSSSSDGEDSRFREVCDPTLWRTAAEGGVKDSDSPVQAASPRQQHDHSTGRQSQILLEKIKASLAAGQTKTASPWVGCRGSGTHRRGSRMGDANVGSVAAPSTLSPYLAKQLFIKLDRNVGFHSSQEDPPPPSQDCANTDHQSFRLLKNLSITQQDSETKRDTQKRKRRAKVPKRLTHYTSSDEEELQTRCSSVAVSPEWILAKGQSCPHPHPKNVRYLDEYRVTERRSDGSIIAVPCPASDATDATKGLGKRKKKKAKEHISENGNNGSCKKVKTHDSKNDITDVNEHSDSIVKVQRKQTRKRGKRKKTDKNCEASAS